MKIKHDSKSIRRPGLGISVRASVTATKKSEAGTRPFAEGEIGGSDDRGALVKLREHVHRPACRSRSTAPRIFLSSSGTCTSSTPKTECNGSHRAPQAIGQRRDRKTGRWSARLARHPFHRRCGSRDPHRPVAMFEMSRSVQFAVRAQKPKVGFWAGNRRSDSGGSSQKGPICQLAARS